MVLAYETLDALTGQKALVKQGEALSCQCCTGCQNLRESVISFMQLQPSVTAEIEFVNSAGSSAIATATAAYANFSAFSRCVFNFSAGNDSVELTVIYYPFGLSALDPNGGNYFRRWTSLLNQERQDVEMAAQVVVEVTMPYASPSGSGTTEFSKSMWFTLEYRTVNNTTTGSFVPLQSKIVTHYALHRVNFLGYNPSAVTYLNANLFSEAIAASYANTGNLIATEIYPAGIGAPYAPRPNRAPLVQYGVAEAAAFRMCLDHSAEAEFDINGHQFSQNYSVIGIDDFMINFLP